MQAGGRVVEPTKVPPIRSAARSWWTRVSCAKRTAAAVFLSAAAVPVGIQEPSRQPVFRAGAELVVVNVFVHDRKGEPVYDLNASDFVLEDAGRQQRILSCELVGSPSGSDSTQSHATETHGSPRLRKEVFILLDDYHIPELRASRVASAVQTFVQSTLRPDDDVSVLFAGDAAADAPPTRDRVALLRKIGELRGHTRMAAPPRSLEREIGGAANGADPEIVAYNRSQLLFATIHSIAELRTQTLSPRVLVLVSGGFIATPLRGKTKGDVFSDFQRVITVLNRHNIAVYSVDIGGMRGVTLNLDGQLPDRGGPATPVGMAPGQGVQSASTNTGLQGMFALSLDTGGLMLTNRNDLDEAFDVVGRDTDSYYVLTYDSELVPKDGKFHKIKVKVKRRGLTVRARPSYLARSKVG
jgi:VWFA-related protein